MTRHQATACYIDDGRGPCPHDAHVVMFATVDGPIGGRRYRAGEKLLACLIHGGHLYDAIHTHAGNRAPWIDADRWITLPVPLLPGHHATTPRPTWTPPSRPRTTRP